MSDMPSAVWEPVASQCERLRVPGGWLYRTWIDSALGTPAHGTVNVTFVAEPRAAAAPLEAEEPPCPHCGETQKIEDTSNGEAPLRRTCLECGKSWRLEVIEPGEGNPNGE